VPVDEFEVDTLTAVLELLAGEEGLRAGVSAAALEYVRAAHDLDRVADFYVGVIEETEGGTAIRDAVLHDVARAAHEVGIGMNDPKLTEIAARFREIGLGD
jgi:hypothetical protein